VKKCLECGYIGDVWGDFFYDEVYDPISDDIELLCVCPKCGNDDNDRLEEIDES